MKTYDLIIIGAGPAGMTAAIYGVRGNLSVLMLDMLAPGGNVLNTNLIENYPGVASINGAELGIQMFEQCNELGVEFEYATVTDVKVEGEKKIITTEEHEEPFEGYTVVVATGTKPNMLHIENELKYAGSKISWCAICDGAKYRGQDVVVIGGGNSAIDEGTYLASMVNHLTIVTDFDLTGDPSTAEYLRNLPNVTVYPYKRVEAFAEKDGAFYGVTFCDKATGENEMTVPCDGVFEYIGASPSTKCVQDLGICESHGYVEHDDHMRTAVEGIYCAGDSNSKFLRQITTACGDGAIAAQEAQAYIKKLRKKQAMGE